MAIGSVSGGAGAVIGGAETAEEILFGMATGAIVGALNHYMHEAGKEEEEEQIANHEKLKITLSSKGVNIDNTDKYTLQMSIKNPSTVAKAAKVFYKKMTGSELNISNLSLSLEIYGHAIAYKYTAGGFKDWIEYKTMNAHCAEQGFDKNRIFWDALEIYVTNPPKNSLFPY